MNAVTVVTPRVVFDGFVPVEQADTALYEVEIGRIEAGGDTFLVHLIRKKGLAFRGDFLVAHVFDTNMVERWWFPKDFEGISLLALAGTEPVIALCARWKHEQNAFGQPRGKRLGKVVEVFPFTGLTRAVSAREKLTLKLQAATYLGREPVLTHAEEKLRALIAAEEAEAAARARAQEARRIQLAELNARAKEHLAREGKVRDILKRSKISITTFDERVRFGVPVIEREWRSLPDGTQVILVHEDTKQPIEAFVVTKVGCRCHKTRLAAARAPGHRSETGKKLNGTPRPIDQILITARAPSAELISVDVYETMDAIRHLRTSKAPKHTVFVTAKDRMVGTRYEVLELSTSAGCRVIGLFAATEPK